MSEPQGLLTDEQGKCFKVKRSQIIRDGYDDQENWYWLIPAGDEK